MKRAVLIIASFVFLNGCAQNTALLGPAIVVGKSGNVYQAGLSYGTNKSIEQLTGKSTTEHISSYVESKNEKKSRQKKLSTFLKAHIESTREKIFLNN
tara:strand:- start:105 stop:398 length:294 start_codon:yes stop_codon:yes gene_type:complete